MNQTIKEYVLELLENTKREIRHLGTQIDNNRIDTDSPIVMRAFTREWLLKDILNVINKVEAENNGV